MPSHIVRGIVVDADGHAVDEAAVSFVDGPGSWPDIAALTGADGRFALTAPVPGRYRLGIRAAGYDLVEVSVEVPVDGASRGEDMDDVTVTLADPDGDG